MIILQKPYHLPNRSLFSHAKSYSNLGFSVVSWIMFLYSCFYITLCWILYRIIKDLYYVGTVYIFMTVASREILFLYTLNVRNIVGKRFYYKLNLMFTLYLKRHKNYNYYFDIFVSAQQIFVYSRRNFYKKSRLTKLIIYIMCIRSKIPIFHISLYYCT